MGSRGARCRMRRSRDTPEVVAAERLVAECATELAEASARMLAEPGSFEARRTLEDAEQLHYLALYALRTARRATQRREALRAFLARWTPVPWSTRARRR